VSAQIRYVTDVAYITSFTPELGPEWLDLVATINGFAAPDRSRRFAWCELGCGRGMTSTIFAATHPAGSFHGVDAMVEHVEHARDVAMRAGVGNLTFHALDFEKARDLPLPQFDYIVAHGVYAWIDEAAAASFRRFIDRHLARGGLVYVSYNAMPGWAVDLPFQHLVYAMAAFESGNSIARFAAVAEKCKALHAAGALSLRQSLIATELAEEKIKRPPAYFAHEYLAPAWHPLYVSEVRKAMGEIGLEPIGSATLRDNFDSFVLRQAARDALAKIEDPDLRELTRDYFMFQRFRRDVYGRAPERLDDDEREARLLASDFTLRQPAEKVEYQMATEAGTVKFDNPVARKIVAVLADGARPLEACEDDPQDLIANALALASAGVIAPVAAKPADVARLNATILDVLDAAKEPTFHVLPRGTALRFEGDFLVARRDQRPVGAEMEPWLALLSKLG